MAGIGLVLLILGALLWIFGATRQDRALLPVKSMDNAFENELNALIAAYPDLPALPSSSVEYDGWFQEVWKRAQIRSVARTQTEWLVLLKQLSECHEHWLKITQTRKALLREVGKDAKHEEIQDLQHQAQRMRLQVEIAEAEKKLKELTEPPKPPSPPAAARDPVQELRDRTQARMRMAHSVVQLMAMAEADRDELKKIYPESAHRSVDSAYRKIIDDLRERL